MAEQNEGTTQGQGSVDTRRARFRERPDWRRSSLWHRIRGKLVQQPAPDGAGVSGACWVWTGVKDRGNKSGRIAIDGVKKLVHRVVIGLAFEGPLHEYDTVRRCGRDYCCAPLHFAYRRKARYEKD